MSSRRIAIAEIARPHGVRGELRLKVYNQETTLVSKGRALFLTKQRAAGAQPDARRVVITSVRETPAALLVRLEGIDDRDAAAAIQGCQLEIDRDELPDLPDGEFYACDVEGARVELVSGDVIGEVEELVTYPSCSVLRVRLTKGGEIEVPLVEAYVALVDTEAHLVKLHHVDEL
ncbi:MAG: ribosome maturation factor RimM [Polyangiaceae bacterium]